MTSAVDGLDLFENRAVVPLAEEPASLVRIQPKNRRALQCPYNLGQYAPAISNVEVNVLAVRQRNLGRSEKVRVDINCMNCPEAFRRPSSCRTKIGSGFHEINNFRGYDEASR